MIYLHYQPGVEADSEYWCPSWYGHGVIKDGVLQVDSLYNDLLDTPWNFTEKAVSLVYLACIAKRLIFGNFVCIDDLLHDKSVKYIIHETEKLAKKHNLPWQKLSFIPETAKKFKENHNFYCGVPKGVAKIIDTGNIIITGYPIEEQHVAEDFLFKYSVRDILEHSNVGIAFTGRNQY